MNLPSSTRLACASFLVGAALAVGASPGAAQSSSGDGGADAALREEKRMVAVPLAESVRLDGRLDDPVWSRASFRSDFQQKGRDRGFDPWARTEVAFVYGEDALLVGARMQRDERAEASDGTLGRRDEPGNSDRILVFLDTFRDGSSAYVFGVTRGGVRIDQISARDQESWADDAFDPVWEARVAQDSAGWSAEMRIPFSQLRFSSGDEQVWGLNVRRWNPSTYLNTYWIVVPYYETGWVSRFGELWGLEGVEGGAGVEITPYALGQATFGPGTPVGGDPDEARTRYGGDLKVGLGSSLTLDATIQPDFGQVEADPARVNLSAFETFFPERRPFFTEGRELFRFRGPNYFYSRRIGSVPGGAVPRGIFERVETATFLGGGKLVGRTPEGLSVGALTALTDRESVEVPDASGTPSSVAAAPRTLFAVGRLQQEVGERGSNVGIIATGVERFFEGGSRLEEALAGQALAGGLDWALRFGGGEYEFTGHAGLSRVAGTASAMDRLQRSSAHFFQRPDADHIELDPDATALHGWAGGATLGKISGSHWRWSMGVDAASPGFEIRDAGSQRRADRVDAQAAVTYQVRDGSGGIRGRSFSLSASGGWNFGSLRRHTSLGTSTSVTWGNLWTTTLDGGVNLPAVSDDLTRGGPVMGTPLAGWLNLDAFSSRVADASWNVGVTSYLDELGGWSGSLSAGWRLQAARWLELRIDAGGTMADDARQFVARLPGGDPETFGERYVFSALERRELFTRLRVNLAFAPDAVLTLYGEPFLSTGRFYDHGELPAAGATEIRRYDGGAESDLTRLEDGSWLVTDGEDTFGIEDYDFWVRSFRSTAVFRWEWRRGSTLYLIWQRSLSSVLDAWGPADGGSFFGAVEDPGENTFVLKLSVLLNPR